LCDTNRRAILLRGFVVMAQVSNLEFLVDNWLKDVQRRGMELYATSPRI